MIDETNTTPGAGSTGTASVLVNVFTAPRDAFTALAARPTVLVPILALALLNTAVVVAYYSQVDTLWLLQTMLEESGRELPPEAAQGQGGGTMGPVMMVAAALGAVLQILIALLLAAGYLSLVSLFGNDGVTFKRWLSLVGWSSMPTLLGMLSTVVNLALNDATHMLPTELNMLSFGNLLGLEAAGGGLLRTMLLNMDPTMLWSLALLAFGYSLWTRRSVLVSLVIVAAPLVVVGGLGLLLAM
ncbi:MAG TPA: YIP1 family protein [Gammaproteobacteria bacterium]